MTWMKRSPDGTITRAEEVRSLGWSLKNKDDTPRDGWQWHDTIESAKEAMPWLGDLTESQQQAILGIGLGLVMQAGPLWDALNEMTPLTPEHKWSTIITAVALESGLKLLEAQGDNS